MNKWTLILLLLVTVGCAGSPVADRTSDSSSATRVAASTDDADSELVCRREKKVGTNMYTRTCKTRREMERERAEAEQTMRRYRDSTSGSRVQSGGGG